MFAVTLIHNQSQVKLHMHVSLRMQEWMCACVWGRLVSGCRYAHIHASYSVQTIVGCVLTILMTNWPLMTSLGWLWMRERERENVCVCVSHGNSPYDLISTGFGIPGKVFCCCNRVWGVLGISDDDLAMTHPCATTSLNFSGTRSTHDCLAEGGGILVAFL